MAGWTGFVQANGSHPGPEDARAEGQYEIARDAELENAQGIAAHLALGYEEVERVVCSRRSLRDA